MKTSTIYLLLVTCIVMAITQGCKKDLKETVPNAKALSVEKAAALSSSSTDYTATTIVGTADTGFVNGYGAAARFNAPYYAAGSDGYLFIADVGNNAIRKVKISDKLVTTLAGGTEGYADGTGTNAKFKYPNSIALGPDNAFYVTDRGNYKIRKVTRAGVVTTFAGTDSGYVDGPVSIAKFGYIAAIAVAKDGSVYVSDIYSQKIRKITRSGIVSTFAGSTSGDADGPRLSAKFRFILNMKFADDGTLYVADAGNNKIKKITPDGMVTTYVGGGPQGADGTGTAAGLGYPTSIAIAPNGSLFIGEYASGHIRLVRKGGVVTTVAGRQHMHSGEPSLDGVGFSASFSTLSELVLYNKALYVPGDNLVQKVTLPDSY